MFKKSILFLMLLVSLVFTSGCQTAKGVTTGMGDTAVGMGTDTYNTLGFLGELDSWIRKNLW